MRTLSGVWTQSGGLGGIDRQSMDLAWHEFAERRIDHPVARHRTLAAERFGDDADAKMAGPLSRAGVARMQVTLIFNAEFQRLEFFDQPLTQACFARRAVHGGAASDCAGFTLPFSQNTWGIMNSSIAAVIPNTLNFTQTPSGKFCAT